MGYSDREMAELLDISRQDVNRQLHQAYECIKKEYLKNDKN